MLGFIISHTQLIAAPAADFPRRVPNGSKVHVDVLWPKYFTLLKKELHNIYIYGYFIIFNVQDIYIYIHIHIIYIYIYV